MARKTTKDGKGGKSRTTVNPYLVNAIAPGRLEYRDTWGVTDDVYFRPMVLTKFREQQALGWCDAFVGSKELKAPVAIVCRPADSGKLAEAINRSIAKAESTLGEGMMSYTDIMRKRREAAHADEMAALLVEDNAKIFDTSIYVVLRSPERKELQSMEDYLKSSLAHYGNNAVRQLANTRAAFMAASPFALRDDYTFETRSVPMPAITLAWGLPTGTTGMDHLEGVEIGDDGLGGLIRLALETHVPERPNSNIFISGETGSGKSTLGKHIVLIEHVVLGAKVLVLGDPESEWGRLALNCGGDVSKVGVDCKFSPFEPRNIGSADAEDDDGELASDYDVAAAREAARKEYVLASTIPFVKTFLQMAFKIDPALMDYLDVALEYLYGDYGIGPETTFEEYYERGLSYPVMVELYDKLCSLSKVTPEFKPEFDRLAMAIRPAAIGHDRHLWNSRTSFSSSTDFTVIDTQGLSNDESIMRAQYFNILTWAWSQVRAQRFSGRYIRLVADELHTIMNKKSVDAAYQIKNIVQRIRKYGGGIMCITPQIIDMLDKDIASAGRAVIYNSAYKFFGKASDDTPGGNLWHVKRLLNLPDDVAAKLGTAPQGKMIVSAGDESSWVHVNAVREWEFELFGKGGGR